jgi:hypothetical protein
MAELSIAAASGTTSSKIKYSRVISCGLVTGAICTLLKELVEEPFFDRRFFEALQAAGSPVQHELPATFRVVAVAATFAIGVYAMWLYAVLLPWYGGGAKTTIIAGFAVWLLIAIVDCVWALFGLIPAQALLAPVLCALPEIVIALFIGARFYHRGMPEERLVQRAETAVSSMARSENHRRLKS